MEKYLSYIPFYDLLTKEEQILCNQNYRIVDFDSKEAVFKQGSFAVNIYIILEGYCKLTYQSSDKKRIIFIHNKGDMIGKDYILKEQYPYSLHALSQTKLMIIPKAFLQEICDSNQQFHLNLLQLSENESTETLWWILNLGMKNIEGAVAMFLLRYCTKKYNGIDFSRAEIADIIGYCRENIIHTLKRFANDELIETKGKSIHIKSREKLKEIIKHS